MPAVENAPLLLDATQTVGDVSGSWDANFGPDRSLTAAARMLVDGTGVVYDYIRTVHESATGAGLAPGSSGYQANLAHYNAAFSAFFSDLAKHGITPANTVFVLTSDEGDHFSPGGNLTTSLSGRLSHLGFNLAQATLLTGSTPLIYWPAGTHQPLARVAGLPGWRYLAQGPVLRAIHAVPANPAYDPQLAIFAQPDWRYGNGSDTSIGTTSYNWNDGTAARGINTLWVGLAGPGVVQGQESREWVDSADILPTLQRLATGKVQSGLDGRAMVDAEQGAQGAGAQARLRALTELYKQLDAPLGTFSRAVLQVGTTEVVDPATGQQLGKGLASIVARRQSVAVELHHLLRLADGGGPLDAATADGLAADARGVIAAAQKLADQALVR